MKYCLFSPRQFCLALTVGVGLLFSPPSRALPIGNLKLEYTVDRWSAEQGLLQNTVYAVSQSPDGYLWIGTTEGLTRYDGVRFKSYRREIEQPDRDDFSCRDIGVDGLGRLWIQTRAGLICYHDHRFDRFPVRRQLGEFGSCPSSKGGVWLGLHHRLVRFDDGKIVQEFPFHSEWDDFPLGQLSEDERGRLWVFNNNFWFRFDPRTDRVTRLSEIVGPLPGTVEGFLEDHLGRLWIFVPGELIEWSNGHRHAYSTEAVCGRAAPGVAVAEDQSGAIWFSPRATGLVVRFRNGRFARYDLGPDIGDTDIRRVWPDAEGSIWIGTGAAGLIRLRSRLFMSLFAQAGKEKREIFSVAPGRGGRLWIGSSGGLLNWRDGRVTAYTNYQGRVAPVLEDRSGQLWFAVNDEGLYTLQQGRFVRVLPSEALGVHNWKIRALYEDHLHRLWIGSDAGLVCFQDHHLLARYTTKDGLLDNIIGAILEDSHGVLWIGSAFGGVARLQDGKVISVLTTRQGLLANFASPIRKDSDGAVWIATPYGLQRILGHVIRTVTTRDGLFDNVAYCLLPDELGNLWASCNRGIWRVRQTELDALIRGRAHWLHCASYGEADGMLSSEANGDYQPSAAVASDGSLWFPTPRGVVVIKPKEAVASHPLPRVVIEQVQVDNQVVFGDDCPEPKHYAESLEGELRLPAGRAQAVVVRFTANVFRSPERVKFRYRLDGEDTQWRESDVREAIYTNLRPGHYLFHVIACNMQGFWNENGPTFGFSVAPHIYETWPFDAACGFAAILLAAGIQAQRLRVQRKMLALEQQAELERERARIARDMHDDLGASVTKIRLLSEIAQKEIAQPGELREHIQRISRTSVEVAQAMDEVVWAVNPRNDTLEQLADYLGQFAEEQAKLSGIRFRLEIPPVLPERHLPADFRHSLFLIVKEALNNVVKHSNATEASVRIRFDSGILAIVIEDNGRGFDFEPDSSSGNGNRNGNGMENLRQRAQKLGGILTIDSRRGAGVSVRLELRLDDTRPRP